MPYAKGHVVTARVRIKKIAMVLNYPICDCSELNNAAARASDTPTEMEILIILFVIVVH